MSPADAMIQRLVNLFGSPDCPDPADYIREVRDSLSKYDADVLTLAGDRVRDNCRFFPRPAEIRDFINQILAERDADRMRNLPPPKPEEFEFVGPDDERYVRALTLARTDAPAYARMIETRGFIKVRKEPVGQRKAAVTAVLTEVSRRMTGDAP